MSRSSPLRITSPALCLELIPLSGTRNEPQREAVLRSMAFQVLLCVDTEVYANAISAEPISPAVFQASSIVGFILLTGSAGFVDGNGGLRYRTPTARILG